MRSNNLDWWKTTVLTDNRHPRPVSSVVPVRTRSPCTLQLGEQIKRSSPPPSHPDGPNLSGPDSSRVRVAASVAQHDATTSEGRICSHTPPPPPPIFTPPPLTWTNFHRRHKGTMRVYGGMWSCTLCRRVVTSGAVRLFLFITPG